MSGLLYCPRLMLFTSPGGADESTLLLFFEVAATLRDSEHSSDEVKGLAQQWLDDYETFEENWHDARWAQGLAEMERYDDDDSE